MFILFIQVFSYKQSEHLLVWSTPIASCSPTRHVYEEPDCLLDAPFIDARRQLLGLLEATSAPG